MLKKLMTSSLGILLLSTSLFALNEEHKVKILEKIDAGAYTYIKVSENAEEYWAAISTTPVKVGSTITIKEQVWMKNFKSKTLDRTFEKVMFADFAKKGISGTDYVHQIHGDMIKKKQKESFKPDPKFNEGLVISKDEAIKTTITDLFKDKEKFKNKNVEIEADVIQVSNKVKGNTWIKLYDGKDAVIFRSPNEDEKVKVGNKVRVMGTVNTDVNYGFGFAYEVIGVNAKFEVLK